MPPMQNMNLQIQQQNNNNNFIPPPQDSRGSISLGLLINYIVQRTYHELTVLAELLPRKTDMERKIEIYNFSAKTRQLFIRLLALVKWANSASKVDKSAHIMSFLDKQSMLFVETADMLSKMARETLVHARLPNFHIPAAVEVLTTGSYNRLPSCIKEKIVPPDPITPAEKRTTLARLNQVIQHRLVTGNLLPQMRTFKIEQGRVTFIVEHEFAVSLTVMGDGEMVPWRLLDIDILVEDKETGDGKALVHTQQVHYIHQLIQTRLADSQQSALSEVYNSLHYFCQSLQLEVLYTQTLRLCRDRLDDNIHVEEYIIGNKLTVSYWRELAGAKDGARSEIGYRLTIQTDPTNSMKSLAIFHMPSLGNKESEVAERAVRTDLLSMERLLVHTVYVRSVARLNEIKTEFKAFLKDVDYHLQGTPAILTVPILHPCLRAEQIHITVDTHTGMLHCHVPKHMDCPIMTDLQNALNNDNSKLPNLVSELRYWITKRRCEKTLQHLPATPKERLPIIMSADHPAATKIGVNLNKMFIQLHRHPNVILIVGLKEKKGSPCEMDYTFFLVFIKQIPIDECSTDDSTIDNAGAGGSSNSQPSGGEIPKTFLRVMTLIEFDTFVATHGPGTYVDDTAIGKRKAAGVSESAPLSKQQKTVYPAYFIPELAHIVAMCDEKLPFIAMAQELTKREIPHSGLQIEANATSLVLKLLTLPKPSQINQQIQDRQAQLEKKADKDKSLDKSNQPAPNDPKQVLNMPKIDNAVWNALMRRLLSVAVRSQINKTNQIRIWVIELVFFSTPLHSTHHKEQGQRRPVYLQYEMLPVDQVHKTIDLFLNDWMRIVYLYSLVHDFSYFYSNDKYNLPNIVTIKSYSYTNLLMQYGPNKEVSVNISWSNETKEFHMTFIGGNNAINAHSTMRDQLQSHLNHNYSLAQIVHLLNETYQPLSSICKLNIIPQLGIPNPKIPVLSFCILPQSPTLLRLSFQGCYCLEIRLRGCGLVAIRDGAYSRFDRSNVVEEFTPTQGLKGFLSRYVDENAVYRRSQSEDDNPPSPITMEQEPHGGPSSVGSSFLSGGGSLTGSMRGPQSPRDPGLKFAAPSTPPSTSNPHTPASPHPAIGHGSQHANFSSMTSPPTHMPHPSPGTSLMPNSPLNPQQPSPMPHSPGPMSYMGGHIDSPFAATGWPGSPSMPRPSPRPGQSPDHKPQISTPHHSRVLPARSWAGAVPTLLTHEALETLCTAAPHPNKAIPGPELSPLERFLGCVFMKRSLQKLISSDDSLILVQANEPGAVHFRVDGLQCRVILNPVHMQSLHLKVTQNMVPPPPNMMIQEKPQYQWNADDLQILEQFFEVKVASPPYRVQSLTGFTKMLNVPPPVLKDLIQIMRLELMPELGQGLKWNVQFCLRVPPSASPIVPVGTSAIVICRSKILFFLQITRVPYMQNMVEGPAQILPLVYDNTTKVTQMAERRDVQTMIATTVNHQLKRFAEICNMQNVQSESTLFAAVRDLLANLTLHNEPQPAQPQMPNPAGVIGHVASPNPQMMPQMVGPQQGGPGPAPPSVAVIKEVIDYGPVPSMQVFQSIR